MFDADQDAQDMPADVLDHRRHVSASTAPPPLSQDPAQAAIQRARAETLAQVLGPALHGGWTDCRPGEVGT